MICGLLTTVAVTSSSAKMLNLTRKTEKKVCFSSESCPFVHRTRSNTNRNYLSLFPSPFLAYLNSIFPEVDLLYFLYTIIRITKTYQVGIPFE